MPGLLKREDQHKSDLPNLINLSKTLRYCMRDFYGESESGRGSRERVKARKRERERERERER